MLSISHQFGLLNFFIRRKKNTKGVFWLSSRVRKFAYLKGILYSFDKIRIYVRFILLYLAVCGRALRRNRLTD